MPLLNIYQDDNVLHGGSYLVYLKDRFCHWFDVYGLELTKAVKLLSLVDKVAFCRNTFKSPEPSQWEGRNFLV